MKKPLSSFWVTNVSNRNVTLSDLALNIPAYRIVNLMDTRHYSYTLEQLQKSAASGSLFKKRDKIILRQTAPVIHPETKAIDRETPRPSQERSILEIKEEKYEELAITDEEFANEASTIEIEADQKPIFTKKD
jgi:hypothetical protein